MTYVSKVINDVYANHLKVNSNFFFKSDGYIITILDTVQQIFDKNSVSRISHV